MSYAEGSKLSAPKANTISNAVAEIDSSIERASKVAQNLQQIVDRVIGPRPSPEGGCAVDGSQPSALIDSIHERRSRLNAILTNIEHNLQTLDGLI